jgi:hypothetical protein
MLCWRDEEDDVKSPLVLKPIQVTRETPRSPYRLVAMAEDVVVNPSLCSKMEAAFGLTLPELDDTTADDILGFLDDVRGRASKRGMSVSDECVVSTFSFHKEVMYRDLKENEGAIAESDVVRALALGHEAGTDLGFERLPDDEIDEEFPPEKALAILDADATQQQCLAAAASGESFVMDGPPGTGKSQTIANMIAGAIHRGQSVLFVSEKAAALEVVASRLAEAGLDEYVLELHSHKARRKEFAAGLAKSLTIRPQAPPRVSRQRLTQLVELRRELNDYAAALNEVREPLGTSLFDAIGRISALQRVSGVPITHADNSLSAEHLNAILGMAAELSRAWGPVERREDFLWRDCVVESADQVTVHGIVRDLESAKDRLRRMVAEAANTAETLGFTAPEAPAAVELLLNSLELMAHAPEYWVSSWILESRADEASLRVRWLAESAGRHSELVESLRAQLGERWRDVDPGPRDKLSDLVLAANSIKPSWRVHPTADAPTLRSASSSCDASIRSVKELAAPTAVLAKGFELTSEEMTIGDLQGVAGLGALTGVAGWTPWASPTPGGQRES